ncbi:uncharacterized protein [Argopecten irradians]|uniref:uncharacterized protein n=1 Tax=Argopecten irradians TaxID=31199 RepID=UPI003715E726
MLSAFVDTHQTDWDEHLPYVMMAYRSTEHETTGSSPNAMMLGRETSTPLDIQYEMPRNIRAIPQNQWAWQLKEKMETAHELVRKHSKAGTTHKLASRWRGPFRVLARLTDVTYRVSCGYKGKPKVIHADRMRLKHPQVLRGESKAEAFERKDVQVQVDESCFESSLPESDEQENVSESEKKLICVENECESDRAIPRRTRHKPKWHSDYTSRY